MIDILLKALSLYFMLLGFVILIALIHITEGELLAEYLPQWCLCVGLQVGGYAIFNNTNKRLK